MSAEFSDNAQTYREAIAGAAGTVPENVVVVSNGLIDETGGPAGFEVQYKILASNVVGISELTSRLGAGDGGPRPSGLTGCRSRPNDALEDTKPVDEQDA